MTFAQIHKEKSSIKTRHGKIIYIRLTTKFAMNHNRFYGNRIIFNREVTTATNIITGDISAKKETSSASINIKLF